MSSSTNYNSPKIYLLTDPRPDRIECYVGQTYQDLCDRLKGHLKDKTNATQQKKRWIEDLARNNMKPEIVLLETIRVTAGDDRNEIVKASELKWMAAFHRSPCHMLVNSHQDIHLSKRVPNAPLVPLYLKKLFTKHLVGTFSQSLNTPDGWVDIPCEVFTYCRSGEVFDINIFRQMTDLWYNDKFSLAFLVFQENTPEKRAAVRDLFDGDIWEPLDAEWPEFDDEAEKLIDLGCPVNNRFVGFLRSNQGDAWCDRMRQKLGV